MLFIVKQIQITYDPFEDRLVSQLSSYEQEGIKLAMTRRFTKLFLPVLDDIQEKLLDISSEVKSDKALTSKSAYDSTTQADQADTIASEATGVPYFSDNQTFEVKTYPLTESPWLISQLKVLEGRFNQGQSSEVERLILHLDLATQFYISDPEVRLDTQRQTLRLPLHYELIEGWKALLQNRVNFAQWNDPVVNIQIPDQDVRVLH